MAPKDVLKRNSTRTKTERNDLGCYRDRGPLGMIELAWGIAGPRGAAHNE